MKRVLIVALLLGLSNAVSAEISAITFAAIVKSFDKDSVTVELNGKKIKLKRSQLPSKISSGEAVIVSLNSKRWHPEDRKGE
jgi:hypothetical protein